jgi:hypothetical protein
MQTNLTEDCKESIKDSDLIQLRYQGCISKQNSYSIPPPKIWQRTPMKKPEIQADAAPTHHPRFPHLIAPQTGFNVLLSDDEWSRQFLLLVNASTDNEISDKDVDNETESCQTNRKRPLSPSIDGDKQTCSTLKSPEY